MQISDTVQILKAAYFYPSAYARWSAQTQTLDRMEHGLRLGRAVGLHRQRRTEDAEV